jgi:hypothetical protein
VSLAIRHSPTLPSLIKRVTRQRPFPHRRLCCPTGSSGTTAPSATLPTRCDFPFRRLYAAAAPDHRTIGVGEGFPSSRAHLLPIPLPLPRRVPQRLQLQVFSAFHGLRRDFSGSAPSCSPCGASLTRLQDSRHTAGWTVAPPEGAFDTALRRRAFPPDAGSLLPGLLAATRTGLTPAGGHELAGGLPQRDHLQTIT